mmetsp:Transcript_18158/g.22314  ORF Transcript_18158/g.22314 Transcript_18158/m.22314 type:complete len:167 (-) Transcript_18158:1278-1778(-)
MEDSRSTPSVIAKLQMDYDLELRKADPDYSKKLRYGLSLCSLMDRGQNRKGLEILYELKAECENQLVPENLYEDCLYHLALCHFRLGEYINSWRVSDVLLKKNATHVGALELRSLSKSTLLRRSLSAFLLVIGIGYLYTYVYSRAESETVSKNSASEIEKIEIELD